MNTKLHVAKVVYCRIYTDTVDLINKEINGEKEKRKRNNNMINDSQ
jgi:hypothetical protein